MNQREILGLFCKSFGLYFIIETALNAKQIIFYSIGAKIVGGDDDVSLFYYLGQNVFDLIVYGLGAWILIAKSNNIADKLVNKTNEELQLTISKSDIIEIVIVAIGGLLIINSIPEILNKITQYLYFNDYSRENRNFFWDDKSRKADIFYSIFKFVVGLVTITNGRLISKRLTKIGDKDEELEKK